MGIFRVKWAICALLLWPAALVYATQAGYFTYQARILDSSNLVPTGSLDYVFQILDPSQSCVLYTEEDLAQSALPSTGVLSHRIGNGKTFCASGCATTSTPAGNNPITGVAFPTTPTPNAGPLPNGMDQIFSNIPLSGATHITGAAANGSGPCNYVPAAGDARVLLVFWAPAGSGNWSAVNSSGETISNVPVASVAETLAGMTAAQSQDLALFGGSITGLSSNTLTVGDSLTSTGTITGGTLTSTGSITSTGNITSGGSITSNGISNTGTINTTGNITTSGGYIQTSGFAGASPPSPSNGAIWLNTTTHELNYYDDTGAEQTIPNGASSGSYVQKAGDTMTGALNLPSNGLAVGSSQLVVSGGNVGIGTASPGSALDISLSNSSLSGAGSHLTLDNPTGAQSVIGFRFAGTPQASIRVDSGGNLVFNTDNGSIWLNNDFGPSTVTFRNPVALSLGPSGIGIGTNSPAGTLDVEGGTAAASTNGTNISIVAQSAGSGGNNNGGDIILTPGTGTGTGMDGGVGIGTTAPACPLNVTRAPASSANSGAVSFGEGPWDGTTSGYFVGNASGTELAINSASTYTGDLANFEVGGVSKFKVDYQGNVTEAGTVTNTGSTTDTGAVNINTTGSGVTTIGGGGGAVYVGNTGTEGVTVGNSSNSTGIAGSTVTINSTGTGATTIGGGSGVTTIGGGTGAVTIGNTSAASTVNGTLDLSGMTSGSVLFAGASGAVSQDNAQLYWDDTNHRLGIGTTSPGAALDIAGGDIHMSSSHSIVWPAGNTGVISYDGSQVTIADQGVTVFQGNGGSSAIGNGTPALPRSVYITGVSAGSPEEVVREVPAQTSPIVEWEGSGGSPMSVIDASGNLGIGTTSSGTNIAVTPGGLADVVGSSNTFLRAYDDVNGDTAGLIAQNTSKEWFIGTNWTGATATNLDFYDVTSGKDRMVIDTNGNIGIGTTTPACLLNVTRAPASSANSGAVSFGEGAWDGTTSGYFVGNASGTELAINSASTYTGDLANFEVGGVSKFKVDYQGNVTEAGTVTNTGSTTDTGAVNINTTGSGVTTIGGGGGAVYVGNAGTEGVTVGNSSNSTGIMGSAVTINSSGAGTTTLGGGSGATTIGGGTGAVTIGNASAATTVNGALDLSGMTSGSVLFAGASGAVSQDNAQLYWDDTNHRLGIGTTSPTAATLEVTGSADGTFLFAGRSNANFQVSTNGSNSSASADLVRASEAGGDQNFRFYTGSTHEWSLGRLAADNTEDLYFWNPSSGKMLYLQQSTGNVGIGTTSPTGKLEAQTNSATYWNDGTAHTWGGTQTPSQGLYVTNSHPNGYDPVLMFQMATSAGTILPAGAIDMTGTANWTDGSPSTETADMLFITRDNASTLQERMRISSSGNVGIGTTSPSDELDVRLSGSTSGNVIAVGNATNGQYGFLGFRSSDTALTLHGATGDPISIAANNHSDDLYIATSGNVGIGTTSPASTLNVTRAPAATANAGSLSLGEGAWDGSTSGYFVGNSNGTELAVNSASSFTGDLANFEVGGVSKFKVDATGAVSSTGGSTQAGAVNINTTGTGVTTVGGGGGAVNIGTSGTEGVSVGSSSNTTGITGSAVTINSSGTGTTTIGGGSGATTIGNGSGAVSIGNTSAATTVNGTLDLSGMTSGSVLFAGASGAVSQDNSQFYWDDTNHRLGIGTTSPVLPVTVSGSVFANSTANNSGIYISAAGGAYGLLQATNAADTGTSNLVLQSYGGNVGIGTTGPSQKLQVEDGNVWIQNQTAGARQGFLVSYNSGATYAGMMSAGPHTTGLGFYTNWDGSAYDPAMVIDPSGNVGIGTTNPGKSLEVNGVVNSIDGSGNAASLSVDANGGHLWANSSYDPSNSGNNWVNDITFNASGDVGIGTTSPGYSLDVVSSGTTQANIATEAPTGIWSYYRIKSGTEYWDVRTNDTANTYGSAGDFSIANAGGAPQLLIQSSSGNVGIGTTSPSDLLQIAVAGSGSGGLSISRSGITTSLDYGASGLELNTGGDHFYLESGASNQHFESSNSGRGDWTFNTTAAGNGSTIFLDNNDTRYGEIGSAVAYGVSASTSDLVVSAVGNLYLGTGDNQRVILTNTEMYPINDNAQAIGDTTHRWSAVYAVNGAIQTSDRRLKHDISSSPFGLEFIDSLRPAQYTYNDTPGVRQGLIAQEVLAALGKDSPAFTGAVIQDPSTKMYGINYAYFVTPLIKAVQQLHARIRRIYSGVVFNAKRIAENESRISRLDKDVTALKTADRHLASVTPYSLENQDLKRQLRAQQKTIEQLKSLVCQDHPHAAVCAK